VFAHVPSGYSLLLFSEKRENSEGQSTNGCIHYIHCSHPHSLTLHHYLYHFFLIAVFRSFFSLFIFLSCYKIEDGSGTNGCRQKIFTYYFGEGAERLV